MVRDAASPSMSESRHHVLGEPAQLLLEFLRGEALGPVDHEIFKPWIFGFDRFDAVDDLRWRTAEPRLLIDAIAQRRHPCRRTGRSPGSPVLVGVTHEPEWREPLVALVMGGLDPPDRLFPAVREVNAGPPDHV